LGDKTYDGGGLAKQFRDEGLFLCSNKIILEHPFYNRPVDKSHSEIDAGVLIDEIRRGDSIVSFTQDHNGTVLLNVEIALPSKFNNIVVGNTSF
jgi:hypothetical protein